MSLSNSLYWSLNRGLRVNFSSYVFFFQKFLVSFWCYHQNSSKNTMHYNSPTNILTICRFYSPHKFNYIFGCYDVNFQYSKLKRLSLELFFPTMRETYWSVIIPTNFHMLSLIHTQMHMSWWLCCCVVQLEIY